MLAENPVLLGRWWILHSGEIYIQLLLEKGRIYPLAFEFVKLFLGYPGELERSLRQSLKVHIIPEVLLLLAPGLPVRMLQQPLGARRNLFRLLVLKFLTSSCASYSLRVPIRALRA